MAASVVISSRNRPQFLSDCVASILDGDELPDEIVIVDQSDIRNPDIATMETRRSVCSLRYVWSETRGISRGRNAGIALARHDVLAFTDDDVVASGGWFAALMRALTQCEGRIVVTGRVSAGRAETTGAFAPSTVESLESVEYHGNVGADVLFSNNMAMRRSAFDEVGWFDPRLGPGTRFPAAEDNDVGLRLLEAGYRIRYVPEAVVVHRAWRTPARYLPLRWTYARGQGAYYAKHLQLGNHLLAHRMKRELLERIGRL